MTCGLREDHCCVRCTLAACLPPPLNHHSQLKALAGSLLLTGLAAGGAFWLMEGAGVVQRDSPISSSALATAVDMVLRPAAISQQLAREQRQHIGADQGASGQAATAAAGQTAALASRGQQQPQQPQ
jgi:hypothetical protein